MEPCFLHAAAAATKIHEGTLTSEALVRSCIERIEERDPLIKAWLYIDKAKVIATAREVDKRPRTGALHGLPFGIKDMIDTRYANLHHRAGASARQGRRLRCGGVIPAR